MQWPHDRKDIKVPVVSHPGRRRMCGTDAANRILVAIKKEPLIGRLWRPISHPSRHANRRVGIAGRKLASTSGALQGVNMFHGTRLKHSSRSIQLENLELEGSELSLVGIASARLKFADE